jgi:hypothetical protein
MVSNVDQSPHNHCIFHEQYKVQIKNLEEEVEKMRIDMSEIKSNTWSPGVVVALIGVFTTIVTTLGGLAGVALSIFAKSYGWG